MVSHVQKFNIKNAHGFSLVELMVALTIFSIVMTISVGTLLVLIDANAKAQALSSSMTNLSFAIDSMTRNIRTGKDYYCTTASSIETALPAKVSGEWPTLDCLTGSTANTALVFTPGFEGVNNTRMAYRIKTVNGNGRIEQWIDKASDPTDTWVPITSDQPPAQVNVKTFEFIVDGSATGNNEQPSISLLIVGSVLNGLSDATLFKVQSNVTQRVLDY